MNGIYRNCDCMHPVLGLPMIPDDYFDLGIIDGPYGIGESSKDFSSRGKLANADKYERKDWDNEPMPQPMIDEIFRVTRHQIIWGCNYFPFDQKATSSGRIVWDKVNGTCDQSDCEIAWTSLFTSVRQFEFMWHGMRQGRSVRAGRHQQGNTALRENRIHPTQKPVALYQWLLQRFAEPGWRLLDTHVGSASSLIAFEALGFDYMGWEKDADYYHQGMARIRKRFNQPLFNNRT